MDETKLGSRGNDASINSPMPGIALAVKKLTTDLSNGGKQVTYAERN
jgi:hypothetical protein